MFTSLSFVSLTPLPRILITELFEIHLTVLCPPTRTLVRSTLTAGRDPRLFRYFLRSSRDASPSRCRPDLARRPRDMARIRGRRRTVETPPEKGRSQLYVPVGNSVLMPHGVSFVSTSTFSAACHIWNYRVYTRARSLARSKSCAVRPDMELCRMSDRLPWLTWRDIHPRQDRLRAKRSRAKMY